MSDPHSHDDVKTAMLGRFDPLEVPLVLQLMEDAGIFAMTKLPHHEPARDSAYGFSSGAGDVLVEAACLETARRLVDEKLPEILAGMQAELEQQFQENA
ncbi:MAG: hypothetical protein ACRDJM_08505 [Actinomycetota bacterium]